MPSAVFVPGALSELPGDVLLGSVAQGDILIRGASTWNNLAASPLVGAILLSGGVGANPSWSNAAPPATANRGLVNLGSGPFDGATAGFFVGHASGTLLAGNAASGFAGDLLSLSVAGVSKFKVTNVGGIAIAGRSSVVDAGAINGVVIMSLGDSFNAIRTYSGKLLFGTTDDVALVRDAAGILAQRNGVNAQEFRLYNTYTDGSNHEYMKVGWAASTFTISMIALGTGNPLRDMSIRAGRDLYLGTAGAAYWRIESAVGSLRPVTDNGYDFGATANRIRRSFLAEYLEVSEMTAPAAPGADKARLYAEDNGAGKTRIMALFPSGAAVQVAIEP